MSSALQNILDILASFGGGRGVPEEEIVRFLLPSFFWALLLYTSANQWLKFRLGRDRIIAIAALIGLVRELFMFSISFSVAKGYVSHESVHPLFPPVEHSLILLSSTLVSYAFCKHFTEIKGLWRYYLYAGVSASTGLYLVTAPTWARFISLHPELKFGAFWGDMLYRITGAVLLLFALIVTTTYRGQKRKPPTLLIIGITLLFLDEFLMIFNLYLKEEYKEVFNPIRHNLHIWAVPSFIGIYWNELRRKLSAKEEQIQKIFELNPNVLCLANPEGKVMIANRAVRDVFGLKEDFIRGKSLKEFGLNLKDMLEGLKNQRTLYSITPYRTPEGQLKWLYWRLLQDAEGGNIYINITDITEKKLLEERLAASEQQYRLLFRYASDAILLFDEASESIEDANYASEMLFGYTAEELKAMSILELSAEPEKTKETITRLRKERLRLLSIPKRLFRRKDGSVFAGEVSIGIYTVKNRHKCIVSIRDITRRLKQEERLKQSEQKLRKLTLHLQKVREEERARIAREIHDELGQLLTAVKIEISSLLNRLDNPQALLRPINKTLGLINSTLNTVKRLSMELRPSVLDHLGIVAAMEWYIEEYEERTGIICHFRASPSSIELPQQVSLSLFRVLQEALTNVARHSKATEVEVNLTLKQRGLLMGIRDNGIGIRREEIEAPDSFGILGIKERIRELGGTVMIEGKSGKGTLIMIELPLQDIIKEDSGKVKEILSSGS